ncbi:MAG TPA: DUF1553 domain-containing protein [Candidatus Dormibacteraeota bacterium]|nr:DUF1553 domain-containing protein [Candidatus Dormibacteraeota bacterium]
MTKLLLLLVLLLVLDFFELGIASASEPLQYNRDIRPLLSDRCFKCHGPDKASRKASLRLDLPDEAYAERKKSHKHAIVAGKPDESLLCEKIFATSPDDRMPPPESNLSLTEKEKQTLRQWIAEGAVYQPHWAFIPLPDSVSVPSTKDRKWPHTELDHFILARLEKEHLKPAPEAERWRWLRRVSYDLTGLPPTPAEIDSFLSDTSIAAFERVVDRLLASPHFGERMAVPWLDVARYADSYGYQSDQLCPTWPYRDWVVRAFNRNLSYDKFLAEQLAGDLMPGATREERLATAFNRLHRQTNEGGSIEDEWRNEYVSDRVHTFSTAALALTFECCRCHDHKFDPITQRDYYSLSAFFNSIDEYGLYNDATHVPTPSLLLPNPEQEKAMAETDRARKAAEAALTKAIENAETEFQQWLPSTNRTAEIPGLVAAFSLDTLATNNFVDDVNTQRFSGPLHGNTLVPGHAGQAVKFNGDDELTFPGIFGNVAPWEQYTVVFWLKVPTALTNGVIFHRLTGTDTGFAGTELTLDEGRLLFVIKRFWPGNAIAIRSREVVSANEWTQVAVAYDGSARAKGMKLFLNGKPLTSEVIRDRLTKSPENGGTGFSFGALFRSTGLKDGLLDDVRFYNRSLAPLELRRSFRGSAGVPVGEAPTAPTQHELRDYFSAAISPAVAQARAARSDAVKKYLEARNPVMETSVMAEMQQPRPAYILARGRYDAPKTTPVTRATPAMLLAFPSGAPANRLGLAQWLADPRHPLTARVAVNRFWQLLFGRGIVGTSENFGAQGAEPTHPELLDWLARDFVNSGWDTKAFLKKVVLSATYRQDSRASNETRKRDPENLLLARGPSQRLPAEMLRDTALAASGLLDEQLGGPPVSPYLPGDLWRESNSMSPAYHQSVGAALYRRSLYTVWKRTAPMPDMTAFDAPSREVCVARRSATSTPQQAFVLLNDTQFVEAARVLAEKALEHENSNPARFQFIFRRLTGRLADPNELKLLSELFEEQRNVFIEEPVRAEKLLAVGETKCATKLPSTDLAAMTQVASAILNSDATVWER